MQTGRTSLLISLNILAIVPKQHINSRAGFTGDSSAATNIWFPNEAHFYFNAHRRVRSGEQKIQTFTKILHFI